MPSYQDQYTKLLALALGPEEPSGQNILVLGTWSIGPEEPSGHLALGPFFLKNDGRSEVKKISKHMFPEKVRNQFPWTRDT